MRTFFLLALLLFARTAAVHAQDISIERLLHLTELPKGHTADLGDWTFRPATALADEENLTWAWHAGYGADTARVPALQLTLRPAPQGYDVLLYLKKLPYYNQLRRELEKQKLVAVPVTCLGAACLGFRFNTPTCTVAFYEGKPGDYPFVVVVQPKAGRAALPAPPVPAGTGQTVKTKVKTKALAAPLLAAPLLAAPASAQR